MKEKILVFFDKAKEKYSSYKESALWFIEECKTIKFWQLYLIVLWILLWLVIFFVANAAITKNKVALSLYIWFAFLLWGWTILAPIFRIVKYFDDKDTAKTLAKKEEIRKELEEFQLWVRDSLREGRYPWMNVDIYLPDDEFCLNVFWIVTYKTKTRTKSIYYGWLRYRIRIAKGLSYTVWNITPARETITYQYVDDTGMLYITNKRIVIKTKKKTDNIPYDKLLYVEIIPWGVEIYKQSWAVQTYYFVWDYDKFPIYLSECLNYTKENNRKKISKKKDNPELPQHWKTEVIHVHI